MYSLPKNYLTPVLYIDTNTVAAAPYSVLTISEVWYLPGIRYQASPVPECWNEIMLSTKENQVLITVTCCGTGALLQVWEFRNNFKTKRIEPDTPRLVYEEYLRYTHQQAQQPQPQVPGSFRSLYTLTGVSLQELSVFNQVNKQATEDRRKQAVQNFLVTTLADCIARLKKALL